MKRVAIKLSEEELEEFDFTGGYEGTEWHLQGETYKYVETIRTDEMSDGPSWDIIVQRVSDDKYFKWNCWERSSEYVMSDGQEYQIKEVFPKTISKVIYE